MIEIVNLTTNAIQFPTFAFPPGISSPASNNLLLPANGSAIVPVIFQATTPGDLTGTSSFSAADQTPLSATVISDQLEIENLALTGTAFRTDWQGDQRLTYNLYASPTLINPT